LIDLSKVTGFDWHQRNTRKNQRHGVSMAETEQLFFNSPLLILPDSKHSESEPRFHALGKTHEGRRLHVSFTLRNGGESIGVISARDMHRKERVIYEQAS